MYKPRFVQNVPGLKWPVVPGTIDNSVNRVYTRLLVHTAKCHQVYTDLWSGNFATKNPAGRRRGRLWTEIV